MRSPERLGYLPVEFRHKTSQVVVPPHSIGGLWLARGQRAPRAEPLMRPRLVVLGYRRSQHAPPVTRAAAAEVVEALGPHRAEPAFGEPVGPWRPIRGADHG